MKFLETAMNLETTLKESETLWFEFLLYVNTKRIAV